MEQKNVFRTIGLLFLSLGCITLHAQNTGNITGKVVTAEGTPVELVAVGVKGTSTGSHTDEQGNFSIRIESGTYTLELSYMGKSSRKQGVNVEANKTTRVGNIVFDIEPTTLDEVVVSGLIQKFSRKESDYVGRMPIKNMENPQVYTVVPKELLSEQVSFDLQSAISTSPGVGNPTTGPGSGGVGLGINMRGFSSLNGIGAIRNGMATNFVTLSDPANLESLEVIKGPSSTLFGTTLVSYGGLINRVTKKAFDYTAGEAGLTTGSNGLGRATLDYNTPLNKEKTFLFRINSAIHREKSFQDLGANRTFLLAPTFTYLVNDRLTLDVDVEYFNSKRTATFVRVSPSSKITNMDELNWDFKKSYTSDDFLSESEALNIYAKASYELSDQWTSQTLYSYANTKNNGNYLFLQVSKPDTITPFMMTIPSVFTTHQIQQNFIGNYHIGSVRNRVVVGIDYTQLVNSNTRATVYYPNFAIQGTFEPNLYQYDVDLSNAKWGRSLRHERTYSAYVSDVVNLTDRLIAMAGLRVDRFHDVENDYKQTALSPKFGLVYQIVKDRVSVFGNFMDGFKNVAPALTEDNGKQAFKPEHGNQWEGGFKFELLSGKLSSTISAYHIKVRDRLTPYTIEGDNNTYYLQDGTQKSKGVEIDLIANPIPGMHILLGYGYNDNKYTKGQYKGLRPYGVSDHIGNVWVSYKLMRGNLKGFGAGFGGNYASDHFLDSNNSITVPGYTRLDATVFYDQPKFRIGLKVNNLTDEEYWASSFNATPQATRQFLANVTYRF